MGCTISNIIGPFLEPFRGTGEIKITMVGLDAAGKTTILHKLKLGQIDERLVRIGLLLEIVHYKNITITVYDTGGCRGYSVIRHELSLVKNIHGLVFVVDSTDRCRIDEASEEFHRILHEDEFLDSTPILVFANKQDDPRAMSSAEITEKLGLNRIDSHKWHMQESSAYSGEGLIEGIEWLMNVIEE